MNPGQQGGLVSEQNKAIVRRWLEEVINTKKVGLIDELLATEYRLHRPGQEVNGIAEVKDLVRVYFAAFPDLQCSIEDMLAEGDKVTTRWTVTGTHKGDLAGIAPTGKRVKVTGIIISRIACTKIAEEWESLDELGMLKQIGALPQ